MFFLPCRTPQYHNLFVLSALIIPSAILSASSQPRRMAGLQCSSLQTTLPCNNFFILPAFNVLICSTPSYGKTFSYCPLPMIFLKAHPPRHIPVVLPLSTGLPCSSPRLFTTPSCWPPSLFSLVAHVIMSQQYHQVRHHLCLPTAVQAIRA